MVPTGEKDVRTQASKQDSQLVWGSLRLAPINNHVMNALVHTIQYSIVHNANSISEYNAVAGSTVQYTIIHVVCVLYSVL